MGIFADKKIGDTVFFGSYRQCPDPDMTRSPIEWIVLDNDERKTTLISKYVLDVTDGEVLSDRLNKDFRLEAFGPDERELLTGEVEAPDFKLLEKLQEISGKEITYLENHLDWKTYDYSDFTFGFIGKNLIADGTPYAISCGLQRLEFSEEYIRNVMWKDYEEYCKESLGTGLADFAGKSGAMYMVGNSEWGDSGYSEDEYACFPHQGETYVCEDGSVIWDREYFKPKTKCIERTGFIGIRPVIYVKT